nr:MAG TPA_asm: hypothetical protein [Caudoviricetes sp.]
MYSWVTSKVFMVGSFCVVPWQRLHFLTQQMLSHIVR